jgi:succinate-acetate transporter protein
MILRCGLDLTFLLLAPVCITGVYPGWNVVDAEGYRGVFAAHYLR